MEGDVEGVRIIPPCIDFRDIDATDGVYSVNITVKNVSKTSKEIRYWGPQNKAFQLKVKNPDKPVAPGLEVPAVIEFQAPEPTEYKDRVVVTVDGKVIEVPIHAIPCRPILSLEGPIKFGQVVANSKVIAKEVVIYNHGSKEGEFKLKYSGDKPVAVIPSSGKIPPRSSQIIKIEYVTKQPGIFDEQIRVRLEGKEPSMLRVCGQVVEGGLELLSHQNQEQLNCISFGSAYYGTDKTESAILFNNSPEPACFVAILDENAEGQEVGTDLSKSTAAALATKDSLSSGEMNPLTSLVTTLPNQGVLAPYEKIPLFFRFSPRWNGSKQGFNCTQQAPPRRDFALFMQLKVVGASKGFQGNNENKSNNNVEGCVLEVALTATALPVILSISPQNKFDFGVCPVGHHVDTLCTLINESASIPVTFQFRRIAHFTTKPAKGQIKPGQTQDVIFSFAPNQVGTFKPNQYVDVLGVVADNKNPFMMHLQVIHSVPICFLGVSDPVTIKKDPKFNPGITPQITNEVGLHVDSKFSDTKDTPWSAVLNSQGTKLHTLKSGKGQDKNDNKAFIAFPNDRAQSIRPSDRRETFKTLFTGTERHTYVDPDYAYTDEQQKLVQDHREKYIDFIEQLRGSRKTQREAKEFQENNNSTDIAIKPAAGLKPKKILLQDVKPDPRPPTPPNAAFGMLSVRNLAKLETSSKDKMRDGLNAVPTTTQEKTDCHKVLSPQQLHQVVVGPPTIDFGSVCLKSVSQKELTIVNNLNQHIHIVVNVDCRELRQTSPLSQVVPPCSKAVLPVIFECSTKGRFQRSLDYTINGFYKNHVTVFAQVVPVALRLSTEELVLEPQIGLPSDAGIRGVITLHNSLNYPAEFTWSPILGERGTAFSVRPATGVVDAFTDLDCEVVFHPSFLAPEDGEFALQVHGGNTLKLKCLAKLGATNVTFIDRRINFGQVPLHLTTTRTAMLKNNSLNHAYYQVLDPNPFPGLTVTPIHGVVPVGGTAELKVHLTPNAVMKFDTRVNISIRGWKTMELRMGGTVEPPCVDIDLPSFTIGGVYCGSSLSVPFKLINKVHTPSRIEFNLQRYSDFSLEFPKKQTTEDYSFQLMNPNIYTVTIEGNEVINCLLVFKPTEVASYDFIMPVTINQTGAPTPSPTPFPPTPTPSHKNSLQHIIQPRPVQVHIATPRRKVVATALRQPLELSHHTLEFVLSPLTHELASSSGIGQSKGTLLVNNSDKELHWSVDLSKGNQVSDDGVFKFLHPSGMPFLNHGGSGVEGTLDPGQTVSLGVLFCPDKPGHYEVTLPIVLNQEYDKPYQYITLVGELKCPHIWFDPLAVVLTPVPLAMDISTTFHIMATDYIKPSKLHVEVPEVESDDGSKLSPLTITFLDGQEIKACSSPDGQSEPVALACRVTFRSPKPLSLVQPLVFIDDLDNKFLLPVTATADNSLLTCYPFLAQHRSDHQIVCEQGLTLKGRKTASRESMNAGEAILIPCDSPHRSSSRPSTTATSSNFDVSSSSFEDSSQSASESTFRGSPREGAVNKVTSDSGQQSRARTDIQSRSLGSALFPDEDSEEGIFHTEVLLAVQRWFASQGWPGGPNPITVPDSLRSGIAKKPAEEKVTNSKGGSWESNNLKKEFRTVYDMISHLCGRSLPGIPINSSLPKDKTERAKQVYWQHSTLLTFLRTQGACIASIKPEYLMEASDYKNWMELQKEIEAAKNKSGRRQIRMKTEEEEAIEDQLFEAVSKRAWTDILLQLLKTVYLSRITPRQFKNLPTPYKSSSVPSVDPDPLCSNVYSISERIVLLWLNHHYEQQRKLIWQDSPKGGTPPSRWVVNFDFDLLDGLVFAAALGAHVPFLVKTHLRDMYTHPATAEQCLHNALKVVNAMRYIGIDYDIQAIDITDPNPISLMLLCLHFYFNLPQYVPKTTIDFIGGLHMLVLRQVKLSNPSAKPLIYHAILAGPDAADFTLPKGDTITVSPKSTLNVSLEFSSRFLRPAEAVLVLVGRRQGSSVGSTLVFNLKTQIDNIVPKINIKVESPCYELNRVPLEVTNPFPKAGNFKVILIESKDTLQSNMGSQSSLTATKKKKPKKIKSKINTGINQSEASDDEDKSTPPLIRQAAQKEEQDEGLMAFHCPSSTVHLEGGATSVVEIHFLPFQMGKMQCSVIFVNEDAGEFVYSIDANATLPQPLALPYRLSTHSVRITSAAAAAYFGSKGTIRGQHLENTVYWKCESGQTLKETLSIPLANATKDRALMLVAQQGMNEKELQRRQVTGTLASGTLTAKALEMLTKTSNAQTLKNNDAKTIEFSVQLNSKQFQAPEKISVANPNYRGNRTAKTESSTQGTSSSSDLPSSDGFVELPISFFAKEPGVYPCQVTLQSPDDIRIYHIECGVTPEGSEARIEFASPVHQPITQEIPIVNQTNHDWMMRAHIEGIGFTGPETMIAKAYQTAKYPLIFRPQFEGNLKGMLVLTNIEDKIEHKFHLEGTGQKPLPLDQVCLEAEVKQSVTRTLRIPNVTKNKLYYRVESDLPYISGPEYVTVLPGKEAHYEMKVTPLRRGRHKGVLAFVAGPNPVQEVDSDGEDEQDDETLLGEYRVWYSVEINISPSKAEKNLKVACPCQKQAILEVGVCNPTNKELVMEVDIQGRDLQGPTEIRVQPKAKYVYELTYTPTVVGTYTGSLVFFHEAVGEFWYNLTLTAEKPLPTTLPQLECELGRWVRQFINLNNHTDQLLHLIPTVSNANNFMLERDNEQPIQLAPHASLSVPFTFMPSTLGQGDHKATIIFHCEQLGEWTFYVSGTGILPQPQDPVSITAVARSNSTLIIPFRNPLDLPVMVDVILKDKELDTKDALGIPGSAQSPFCLLLKQDKQVRLGPKSILDIPLSFSPEEMMMSEAECLVVIRKLDGSSWFATPSMELKAPERSFAGWDTSEIQWLYPIRGYPEQTQSKDMPTASITCQARERVEERLEVSLSGVAPSASGHKRGIRTRAVTPKNEKPRIPEGVVVAEGLTPADEFSYELVYKQAEARSDLDTTVALKMVRQQRDKLTGLVTLVFDIVYAPYKAMSHDVELLVQGATGGLWRFPLHFTASEPEPDDTIIIEAAGLDKESSVGFRLNSQSRRPIPYNAYFIAGSDPEFAVSPSSGELLPTGTNGTLIKINFSPTKYGKIYQGKLIVQAPDMQWTYSVRGVLPDYTPPRGYSSKPMAGPHPDPRRRTDKTNYVKENLRLTTTAVSSPIKGAPLVPKNHPLNRLVLS